MGRDEFQLQRRRVTLGPIRTGPPEPDRAAQSVTRIGMVERRVQGKKTTEPTPFDFDPLGQ